MWTKIWSSLGFIVVFGFAVVLATQQQKRLTDNRRAGTSGIVNYCFGVATLLLGFIQFWLLTRIFPRLSVVLLLMLASSSGLVVYNVIGRIAGFSEQQQKIKVLTAVWSTKWGAKHPRQACLMAVAAILVVFCAPLVALYKFWTLPIGSSEAITWVTFLLFVLPHTAGVLIGWGFTGPNLISPFVDDDVRNSFLTSQLSVAIYSTVALVFPVSILSENAQFLRRLALPQGEVYWLAVTAPLTLFFVIGTLPYLIGIFRHRSKTRTLLKWRKEWLKAIQKIAVKPTLPNRAQLFAEKIENLKEAVKTRLADNQIIELYDQFRVARPAIPALLPAPSTLNEPHVLPESVPGVEAIPTSTVANSNSGDAASVTVSADRPANPASPPSSPTASPLTKVRELIEEHADKFAEWDTQFRDLDRLMDLQESLTGSDPLQVKDFVEVELKDTEEELAALHPKRHAIVSWLLTAVPALGSWLFKTYQTDIMTLIRRLAS